MDKKTWLGRKRFIVVNSEDGISKKGNEEEKLPYDKEAALEETVKNLHEQVACLLCECNAKDELMAEHVKTTQEAITGREKAEEQLAIWKQELEDVLQENIAANERLFHLDGALKNCRRQLSCLIVEQDRRVNQEKAHKKLETKYTKARKKLANLTIENDQLTKSLAKKDKIIDATADYHVLKREFKMRTLHADKANQKHQESAKLEAGRQRLRLLTRKRIAGHKKTKPSAHQKAVDKQMSLVIKQLCEVEEENQILKESVCQRENEICILKAEVAGSNKHVHEDHLESENKIVSLKMELERLNDHFENLKLINVDLDLKLFAAKVENKQVLEKVSVLEMELEDRCHHYEGLETTCLELQLQLATVFSKNEVTEDFEQEGNLGLDITTKLSQSSSLHDDMALEDMFHMKNPPNSPIIEQIISSTEAKDVVIQALPIVPMKKHGKHTESLWKFPLLRRKRGGNKKKLHVLATYHI